MKDTFCPIPWIFQAARTNGDIRVCCQANVTKNKGIIRKDNDVPYNVARDNPSDSRNAELMKQMRLNMLNGVWNEECGRCMQEEQSGLVSRREFENEEWDYNLEQARLETAVDGSVDVKKTPIRYYDLRFGNFCNLKCRMCGPTDSNSWYEDWIELTGSHTFQETNGEVEIIRKDNKLHANGYDWPNHEPFWEYLEINIENIEHVYFAGGEPMLIDRHYIFLQKCIDRGQSKKMKIEYNTNMTTIPSRVIDLWKEFKHVIIGASVDGMGDMLEYQRYPAKWEKVYRNLQKIDELPENVQSWITYTVTAYNINHMIDFMKWKLENSNWRKINSTKKKPIISPHIAHHPLNLNIRVLPDEMKKEITDKFEDFVIWTEHNYPDHVIKQAKRLSSSICNYMNSGSYYLDHWDSFLNYTNTLDNIRNQKLIDVEPMFKGYIK